MVFLRSFKLKRFNLDKDEYLVYQNDDYASWMVSPKNNKLKCYKLGKDSRYLVTRVVDYLSGIVFSGFSEFMWDKLVKDGYLVNQVADYTSGMVPPGTSEFKRYNFGKNGYLV